KNIPAVDFYPSYITTYIERDVRAIKNIEDLNTFSRFLKLCAGRIGQPLNFASLASDTDISPNTAKSWLSILEASYIIYTLPPHYANFNKRLIKSPKLYFYDTGVACSLLGLESKEQLMTHYLMGNLFENFIINELLKSKFNEGKKHNFYFWQDKSSKEVDLLVDKAGDLLPFEIKSGATLNKSYFRNLWYWQKLSGVADKNLSVIYGGEQDFKAAYGQFISWKNLESVIESI
ncbi:MAG: DUF4143 domain-containing protein, partial [Bacteroidota bacterium]